MLELAYLFVLWIRNLFWDRIIALAIINGTLSNMCDNAYSEKSCGITNLWLNIIRIINIFSVIPILRLQ
jgi:hypothetical protein